MPSDIKRSSLDEKRKKEYGDQLTREEILQGRERRKV
jgi:hypothetical protein